MSADSTRRVGVCSDLSSLPAPHSLVLSLQPLLTPGQAPRALFTGTHLLPSSPAARLLSGSPVLVHVGITVGIP